MDPNRKTDRILDEWDAVARMARRPVRAPRRRGLAGLGSTLGLVGAALVAAALVVAVGWLGGRIASPGDVGSRGSESASPSAVPTPTPVASAVAAASSPPAPTTGPCDPANLAARITAWEGAAGSRIADVSLTSTGETPCLMPETPRPQLVDGRGAVLAQGKITAGSPMIEVATGDVLTTLVEVSNVCVQPVPPVTVAFDMGGERRLVAQPYGPTDATVPPCNGPGRPAEIQMHPWSR
ncbi:MAG: DUF4232 domain-containing protein [Chloroflexi bacterium]|nr:MAG: DUF4232 domain-containing protein [Chloroflexota bacterium]